MNEGNKPHSRLLDCFLNFYIKVISSPLTSNCWWPPVTITPKNKVKNDMIKVRYGYMIFNIKHFYFRQKMAEILIHDLHNLAGEAIKTMTHSRSYQIISERQVSWVER